MNHLRFAGYLCVLLLVCVLSPGCSGPKPYENLPTVQPALGEWHEQEIRTYERADAQAIPKPGQVLFIGSSSVRMWSSLASDMSPAPVINRGFGGSTTPEVLAVMNRIVLPYEPSVIVYYCGDNDLGTDNTDSESAAAGFIQFAERVHEALPGTRILYMSIKPSLARWDNWAAMARANRIVEAWCEDHAFAGYLDLASPLLNGNGEPDSSLFMDDGLHLNGAGYARWAEIVRPRVLDAYAKAKRP